MDGSCSRSQTKRRGSKDARGGANKRDDAHRMGKAIIDLPPFFGEANCLLVALPGLMPAGCQS
jgi:hypothetical protein